MPALNHNINQIALIDQHIGNLHKTFPGQCDYYFYITGCDVGLTFDEQDVGNLTKLYKDIVEVLLSNI